MLRHWRNIGLVLSVCVFGLSGYTGLAQTTPAPTPSPVPAINPLTIDPTQAGTADIDPEAVRRAIAQMDETLRTETAKTLNNKPVYDGKNLIFNVNGVVYSFDITEGARSTTKALTTFVVNPPVPRAHQDVEVRVSNFSTNIVEDRITWTVNNVIVQDQIGGESIKLRMGDIGEPTHILVTVLSRKLGEVFSKELTLTPGDVAILWEANTYIPPFYKGKPLPSYRSTIKLIPFPTMLVEGHTVPPEDLLYQWSRDYRNVASISGYGKRYAFIEASGGATEELLTLKVKDPESKGETERSIAISIVEPKILLYAGSPLQGTRYEQALKNTFNLGTQETTIKGEPLFISNEELLDGSSPLTWKQNGREIPSLYRSVTLQKPNTSGSSQIKASFENPKRVLQYAEAGLTITYRGN